MWLRRVPARRVFKLHRELQAAGLDVSRSQLETQFLAGGDIDAIAQALIAAKSLGLKAGWLELSVLDLEGMDVLALVNARAPLKRVLGSPGYERVKKIQTVPVDGKQ
ncbi:MAG: flotillin-like FloA family protein [Phycisphaerales bacterium]|nr:flotillin-like FloA family protein [Phycisphaerales bacterium]